MIGTLVIDERIFLISHISLAGGKLVFHARSLHPITGTIALRGDVAVFGDDGQLVVRCPSTRDGTTFTADGQHIRFDWPVSLDTLTWHQKAATT